MPFDFRTWVRQPSTITGISVLAATAVGTVVYYLTHSAPETGSAVGVVLAALHLSINDNSAMPTDVEKLAIDAATAIASRKLSAAIPALFADVSAVVSDVQAPAVVAPAAVTVGAAA